GGKLTLYGYPDPDHNQGYRWRGRTVQHILTSGLDDYPRAPPHSGELHVDALSWIGTMATALGVISAFLGKKTDEAVFQRHKINIIRSLDSIHWSETQQGYCDTTVGESGQIEQICHKGYISLFPFTNGLVGPDHPHLEAILDLIRDPEKLWSPFGLRSLSLKDAYYGTGENYWRSPVWVNINYMVIDRLLDLAQQPGPHQRKARGIYIDLRQIIVDTVFNSWQETGFAWEQYNPDTGKGQRTQHFTGWTALVVKIMAMPDLRPEHDVMEYPHNERIGETGNWSPRLAVVVVVVCMVLAWYMFRRKLLLGPWRLVKVRYFVRDR
ncbi:MAG: hypothetical protein Q9228_007815, partial [Teloschistes exilis]